MLLTNKRGCGRPRVKPMTVTQLGQEVRRARAAKRLSLDALSRRTKALDPTEKGVGLRTIHAIEQGESEHPTNETLRLLGLALEPETDYRHLALAAYDANGDAPPVPLENPTSAPPEAVSGAPPS